MGLGERLRDRGRGDSCSGTGKSDKEERGTWSEREQGSGDSGSGTGKSDRERDME